MTNLLTRIKDLIMADLNETVKQKEDKNPIALLNQYLRQCEQETEKVGKLVERQSQLKEEFTRERNEARELVLKRQYQAEIALKAGETELYEFATAEHQHYANRLDRLSTALSEVSEQLQQLERKHEEMKHKLKDMHLRRMELMGRENVTRANVQINQVLEYNTHSGKSLSRFEEIEGYLDSLEQRVNSSFHRSTIDGQIAQLEKEMKKNEETINLMK